MHSRAQGESHQIKNPQMKEKRKMIATTPIGEVARAEAAGGALMNTNNTKSGSSKKGTKKEEKVGTDGTPILPKAKEKEKEEEEEEEEKAKEKEEDLRIVGTIGTGIKIGKAEGKNGQTLGTQVLKLLLTLKKQGMILQKMLT